MSTAELCGKLILCLFGSAGLAFIPLTFGVGINTMSLLNGSEFQECFTNNAPSSNSQPNWHDYYNYYDYISTSQPSEAELDVLVAMGWIACILLCCSCCIARTDDPEKKQMCIASTWLLNAFIGSCLFMHIYTYLNEIDSKIPCMTYIDGFDDVYNWSIAGVFVGSVIVSLTCCFCCYGVLIGAGIVKNTDNKNTYNNNNNNNNTLNRPLVIVDERDNNNNSYPVDNNNVYRPPNTEFDDLSMSQKRRVVGLVSLAVVEECGFVIATENNRRYVLNRLNATQPTGQTALRDAVVYGIDKLLALKIVIAKLGVIEHKFIHIVLTDGADTTSQCTLNDIQRLFLELGREIGDLCTTFFIGVNLGYNEQSQLQSIADLAGDAAELYNCQDVQLSDVFDRIKLRIGIQRQLAVVTDGTNFLAAQRNQLYMTAEKQKFLVLFTLDKSGSMSGGRWSRVCGAVNGFCQGMGENDIIGCVLFNDKVTFITE